MDSPNSLVIETHNLSKTYKEVHALQDLNLTVKEHSIFGFLGPNGAGKTTSINMMVGLLSPTSGKVLIEGKEITAHSRVIKEKVGVCPQNVVLWPMLTAKENLLFMGDNFDVPFHIDT